jgi:hypothetical protein
LFFLVCCCFCFVCCYFCFVCYFNFVFFFRHRDGLAGLCTGPLSARPLVAHLLTKIDKFQCTN